MNRGYYTLNRIDELHVDLLTTIQETLHINHD